MTQTMTGPTIIRSCGCQDLDPPSESSCLTCNGSGIVTSDLHPFVTLETLHEHLEGIRIAMGVLHPGDMEPKIGTPFYHWKACEGAVCSLFQQLFLMLPEEYARTEGD